LVKARSATGNIIARAIDEVLRQPTFADAARRWQTSFARHDAAAKFAEFVDRFTAASFAA
jgi:UDP:flavonoid glycosyltransferase YjiC (YdhE family)